MMIQTNFKKRRAHQVTRNQNLEYAPGPIDHRMLIYKERRYGFVTQPRFKKRRAY
ncbi:MAG TPA: hypothetical protein VJY43_04505 [Methanocorpusculum sp.]|nr:hypothetical protein [Methanocorpusculum sp.]